MIENTNRTIAINAVILYIKLFLITICGLLTTRFALNALGVNDFGLFSLLGSIITFISVLNTVMISTSNRFISVAIGKGELRNINEQFNICRIIHVGIAILTFVVAIPLGDFYIQNYLHYDGSLSKAIDVYYLTIVGSIISFIGVPYNGLLIAKEKFLVFSITEVFTHTFKLGATLLLFYFEEKLLIYAFIQGLMTATPTIIYHFYCRKKYSDIIAFIIPRDLKKYKEIFLFSGWVAYGAFATIGKSQGAQILVNSFFNTVMNTALGIANTVNGLLVTFAGSIAQPIMPQITKSYVAGNYLRCNDLLVMSTKYTFLLTLFISTPFLFGSHWILSIWLDKLPPYVLSFTSLVIVDTLVSSLNSGISNLIFASGKIKLYQISINTLRLLSIIVAYIALKFGCPAHTLLFVYILFSVIIFFVGQWVLHHTLNYDNHILWKHSYFPSFMVIVLMLPLFFVKIIPVDWMNIILIQIILLFIIMFIGLSKKERNSISKIIKIW